MGHYNHPKDPYGWRIKSYRDLLGGALKRHKPETRILQLTEPQGRKSDVVNVKPQDEKDTTGWPCSPRHGPVIGQPDMIFDLPGYQANMREHTDPILINLNSYPHKNIKDFLSYILMYW